MRKRIFIINLLATTLVFIGASNPIFAQTTQKQIKMKRVTGIGGIFFKCKDPEKLNQWYKTHLGLETSPYGAKVEWSQEPNATKKGYTLWTPFPEKTKYFEPSNQSFMINYRVENIEALVAELIKEGVTVLDKVETYAEYGKFVHVLDLEGNKIELWEPNKGE